eukprot:3696696-Prymnesium_polylepis.1
MCRIAAFFSSQRGHVQGAATLGCPLSSSSASVRKTVQPAQTVQLLHAVHVASGCAQFWTNTTLSVRAATPLDASNRPPPPPEASRMQPAGAPSTP